MIFDCPSHGLEYENPCKLAYQDEHFDLWGLFDSESKFKRKLSFSELQFTYLNHFFGDEVQ